MSKKITNDIVVLTRSRDKADITIATKFIMSFSWIDRFEATVINMYNAPSIWVEETPEKLYELLGIVSDEVDGA